MTMGRRSTVTIKKDKWTYEGEVKAFVHGGGYIPMPQECVGAKVKIKVIPMMIE